MGKLTNKITAIIMTLSLPILCALQNVTPVEAAGASSATDTYVWHKAMSVDELRGEWDDDLDAATDSYKGKWTPIIIVATYPDGTSYYLNRNTTFANLHSPDVHVTVPKMSEVSATGGTIAATLARGIASGEDFYSLGDLSAMHMYYHGYVKKGFRVGRYGSKYRDSEGDAWSLTMDDLETETSEPKTVLGVSGAQNKWTLDVNTVHSWKGVGDIPETRGDYYTLYTGYGYTYDEQWPAWTFMPDYKYNGKNESDESQNFDEYPGAFNIATFFGHGPYYNAHYYTTWIPLWGAALMGTHESFQKVSLDGRQWIDTPKALQPNALLPNEDGQTVTPKEYALTAARVINRTYSSLSGDTARSHDDTSPCRVRYSVYVGKKVAAMEVSEGYTVKDGAEIRLAYGSTIAEGATVTVEKGGTLYVSRDSSIYLNGNIVNYGTVIVESGATIGAQNTVGSYIKCMDGGKLIIMEGSIVYTGWILVWNGSTCITDGVLETARGIIMGDSRLEIGNTGEFLPGFFNLYADAIFSQLGNSVEFWMTQGYYHPITAYGTNYAVLNGKIWNMYGDSKMILQDNGRAYYANLLKDDGSGTAAFEKTWEAADGEIQGVRLGKLVSQQEESLAGRPYIIGKEYIYRVIRNTN